jgi:hypothetical protein
MEIADGSLRPKGDAEPGFQSRDLVTNGRSTDVQHSLSRCEAAGFHHSRKDAEQAEIDSVQPSQAGPPSDSRGRGGRPGIRG